jgi:hypothetical protein
MASIGKKRRAVRFGENNMANNINIFPFTMFKAAHHITTLCTTVLVCTAGVAATETLHPITPPSSHAATHWGVELDDDVYSSDVTLSAEYAPLARVSVYADASFRFLSYSYEYSTEGYIHNYCNLHVNGFNETYAGVKAMLWRGVGIDLGWRFPPGEGSQVARFHRLNVEPFTTLQFSRDLLVGTALRYNTFLEEGGFKPGDEVGVRGSFVWRFGQNARRTAGWQLTEKFLYQVRIEDSENRNLARPYRQMKDQYRGMKIDYEIMRYFEIFKVPLGIGLNYQIKKGTLFGFETGHLIGVSVGGR